MEDRAEMNPFSFIVAFDNKLHDMGIDIVRSVNLYTASNKKGTLTDCVTSIGNYAGTNSVIVTRVTCEYVPCAR